MRVLARPIVLTSQQRNTVLPKSLACNALAILPLKSAWSDFQEQPELLNDVGGHLGGGFLWKQVVACAVHLKESV